VILIVRVLLGILSLAVVALAMFAAGLTIGLAGAAVLALTGRSGGVNAGAELIRSIERLAFGSWRRGRTFVYFIRDEFGATKIGISADPHQRVATLQTGHPEALYLHNTVPCRSGADARAVEGDLHDCFARQRMNGEWFDLDDRQLRRALRLARRWR